jgi:GntR family transcriptional regulator
MLDFANPLPLYHQLRSALVEGIVNGRYPPGEAFPSERELVERFEVSRVTVRQALQELVREGYLRRERGRGSFVIASKLSRQADRLASLDEDEMAVRAPIRVQEVGFRKLGGSDRVPACFTPAREDCLYRIERVALLADEPVIHSSMFVRLPADTALTSHMLRESLSVYSLIEQRFRIKIAHGSRTLEAVAARKANSLRLHVDVGAPVLLVRTTTFDSIGRAITYAESWYRGDRWQYSIPNVLRRTSPSLSGLVPVSMM